MRGGFGDFGDTFRTDYDELGSLGKPLVVSETSISMWSDEERAAYVSDLLTNELPKNFPNFRALVWFNEPGWGDLLGDNYTQQQAAFRAGLAHAYYRGR
jgi:hypothetical protein